MINIRRARCRLSAACPVLVGRDLGSGDDAVSAYVVSFADPQVVVATDRSTPAVLTAVARARALLRSGGHIWVVREHVSTSEQAAWNTTLAGLDGRPALGNQVLEVSLR